MESYPPLFRKNTISNLDPTPTIPNHHPNLDIPSIDFNHLDAKQLGQACRAFGLFRLINHGIPISISSRLHEEAKKILSLPFETKEEKIKNPTGYFWGTPALTLNVKDVNWVEGLHVQLGQIHSKEVEADDLELGSCSSFRSLLNHYGQHMACISRVIFDALSTNLNLDSNLSSSYLYECDGILRVYRYPRCSDAFNNLGMVGHTDSSVLSILNQDDVGGLQVLHNNQWFNVTPISDTLIVNLGDMMQAMSNDEYKSVEHRVLANGSKERISLCYFAFPMEDGVIVSSKYRAFTYKEFRAQVQEDIKACGSKVGLEHFKIKESMLSIPGHARNYKYGVQNVFQKTQM